MKIFNLLISLITIFLSLHSNAQIIRGGKADFYTMWTPIEVGYIENKYTVLRQGKPEKETVKNVYGTIIANFGAGITFRKNDKTELFDAEIDIGIGLDNYTYLDNSGVEKEIDESIMLVKSSIMPAITKYFALGPVVKLQTIERSPKFAYGYRLRFKIPDGFDFDIFYVDIEGYNGNFIPSNIRVGVFERL
ncbi:MAG: hypothetical protein QE271_04000 [Bacteriovoracaceae bacterium]|nr:hypothetical protein [Bacteriovoracaceae bacterium]